MANGIERVYRLFCWRLINTRQYNCFIFALVDPVIFFFLFRSDGLWPLTSQFHRAICAIDRKLIQTVPLFIFLDNLIEGLDYFIVVGPGVGK